ncbi:MAG: FeoA family protein [Promethearchaeota archaeon]
MNFKTSSKQSNQNALETTLSNIPIDSEAIVVRILAGIRATQRLSEMGITPGTKIHILSQAPFRGPIQISVRGTRLALGQGLSEKIIMRR